MTPARDRTTGGAKARRHGAAREHGGAASAHGGKATWRITGGATSARDGVAHRGGRPRRGMARRRGVARGAQGGGLPASGAAASAQAPQRASAAPARLSPGGRAGRRERQPLPRTASSSSVCSWRVLSLAFRRKGAPARSAGASMRRFRRNRRSPIVRERARRRGRGGASLLETRCGGETALRREPQTRGRRNAGAGAGSPSRRVRREGGASLQASGPRNGRTLHQVDEFLLGVHASFAYRWYTWVFVVEGDMVRLVGDVLGVAPARHQLEDLPFARREAEALRHRPLSAHAGEASPCPRRSVPACHLQVQVELPSKGCAEEDHAQVHPRRSMTTAAQARGPDRYRHPLGGSGGSKAGRRRQLGKGEKAEGGPACPNRRQARRRTRCAADGRRSSAGIRRSQPRVCRRTAWQRTPHTRTPRGGTPRGEAARTQAKPASKGNACRYFVAQKVALAETDMHTALAAAAATTAS